jgi:CubicO group peptidase (beta-lactamase class C family)
MSTLINRPIRVSIALIFSGAVTIAGAQPKNSESIDAAVKSFMAEKKIPGFAMGIVKKRSIIWSKAYGQANIEDKTPMSVDGIMNIGSISKTFTTVAAMQFWEKGMLDLNADINKYLDFEVRNPKYPDKPITVFQVLTHTSSIQDGKAYSHSYSCGDPTIALHDWILENLTPKGKFYDNGSNFGEWAPGSGQRRYSNVSFGLLGLIIERIARQPFNQYCREHIFKPLSMKNTGWMLNEVNTQNHIIPYAYVTEKNRNSLMERKQLYPKGGEFLPGTFVPACLYSFPNYPDGLVRTSVKELSNYLIAMMNGGKFKGKRILKKETVSKMLSLQTVNYKFQGLTWHIYEWDVPGNNEILWGHTGGDPGIITYLFFNPVSKLGIITFQNASTDGTSGLFEKLYPLAVLQLKIKRQNN